MIKTLREAPSLQSLVIIIINICSKITDLHFYYIELVKTSNNYNNILWQEKTPVVIFLLKVNNGRTRTMRESETCSKLTEKAPKDVNNVILVSLFLIFTGFHAYFWRFHCLL